ncbi:MAG: hypothetical protein HOD92_07420 [Deltaproteobacteria bacterium]|jgi:stage V sporulation protein R|nr:hypothetical protein [Deltaproteobacteria bacterium]MBT4525861.1 hypothetical protein [Deltaproteobacteria bacterium]
MRLINTNPELFELEQRVKHHAKAMNRSLPEMRFFILDRLEFASLLEKHVYPTSPSNIWEGKKMINKKLQIESGQESGIYYEVVQTGNPSYAYLNNTNSPMMQASVMAHVVGHCEFSELNVLKDSNMDRTEFVMHLVKKVDSSRFQMGEKNYLNFWNAAESIIPLIAPHSQFNLNRSVEDDTHHGQETDSAVPEEENKVLLRPFSHTMESLLKTSSNEQIWQEELQKKTQQEQISRQGYRLFAPCQDILGFLKNYAPCSQSEKSILNYMYVTHSTHDFVVRTQIMNEGWAMYWEKKIMMELFKEKAVKGIIDYAKTFSGVCFPRPFFARNPYHLGYNLWSHLEHLYEKGKISLDYWEETDQQKKNEWDKKPFNRPIQELENLVKTITDYEFLRRFLTPELIFKFHLNRIPKQQVKGMGVNKNDILKEDDHWSWIQPNMVKNEMLNFFTHFYRPRIYIIDNDFKDGGLLIFHRNDYRKLRKDWIRPTLANINFIWKSPVYLVSGNTLYSYSNHKMDEIEVNEVSFGQIAEKLQNFEKPFVV